MCFGLPQPSALFGTRAEIEKLRPRSQSTNTFQFGEQTIHTKVHMMIPAEAPTEYVDVTDAMQDPPIGQSILLEMANMDWDSFVNAQETQS